MEERNNLRRRTTKTNKSDDMTHALFGFFQNITYFHFGEEGGGEERTRGDST